MDGLRWTVLVSALWIASSWGCGGGAPAGSGDADGGASDGGSDDADAGQPTPDGGDAGESERGTLVLDEGFGDDGMIRVRSIGTTDWIWAATRAPDGDILAAGGTTNGLGHRFEGLVTRFNAVDGSRDSNWGEDGIALLAFHDRVELTGIEALNDGSVMVAGNSSYGPRRFAFVARLGADGALDESFGTAGVTSWEGPNDGIHAIAVADDGVCHALTEVGRSSRPELRRLGANGAIDESFGDGGVLTVLGQQPRELLIQNDGSVLALTSVDTHESFLTRITAAGVVDTTFGDEGTVRIPFDAYAMAPSPGGEELAVVGEAPGGVLKLDSNGMRVAEFGTNGFLEVTATGELVDVQWSSSDGILVLEGQDVEFPAASPVAVHRMEPDGTEVAFASDAIDPRFSYLSHLIASDTAVYLVGTQLESTTAEAKASVLALDLTGAAVPGFGSDGLAQAASTATSEILVDMARRSDGSLVAAGPSFVVGLVVRFADGAQDLSFGTGGFVNTNPVAGPLLRLAADDDNRIVGSSGGHLVRLLADGSADPAFGDDGKATGLPANASLYGVAMDAEGRVVSAGEVIGGGPLLVRVLSDGRPDPTFGQDGAVVNPGGLMGMFGAVMPEDDGLVVAGGDSGRMLVVRLGLDGTLDSTFGDGGSTIIDDGPLGLRLLPRRGGGYLVGGYGGNGSRCFEDCSLSVVALDADGAVDTSFGEGGTASVTARYFRGWMGMAQLTDGSIIVGGAVAGEQFEQMALWRLSSTGRVDESFGDGGVFLLPGRGRATAVLADGDGALVAGIHTHPATGTDAVLLQFRADP